MRSSALNNLLACSSWLGISATDFNPLAASGKDHDTLIMRLSLTLLSDNSGAVPCPNETSIMPKSASATAV
jgi:hypothetical protein